VRKVMNDFFRLQAARADLLLSRVDLLLSMAGIEKIDCVNRGTADFRLPPVKAELFALNAGKQHGQQSKACSRSGETSD